jgi:hypothetical protein
MNVEGRIKKYLVGINSREDAEIAADEDVQGLVEILGEYPEGWEILRRWDESKPMFRIQGSFSISKMIQHMDDILRQDSYMNRFASDFIQIYDGVSQESAESIQEFLDRLEERGLVETSDEMIEICPYCGSVFFNRVQDSETCPEHSIRLNSVYRCDFTNSIKKSIRRGILLEKYCAEELAQGDINVVSTELDGLSANTSLEYEVSLDEPRDIDITAFIIKDTSDRGVHLHTVLIEYKISGMKDSNLSSKNGDFNKLFSRFKDEFYTDFDHIFLHKLFAGYYADETIKNVPYNDSLIVELGNLNRIDEMINDKIHLYSYERSLNT